MKVDPEGQPSVTTWKVMGRADDNGKPITWLALEPLTGRTHQLRVHCAAMGWPIVGDTIYGNTPRTGGPPLHLHAREVVVPLYKNKEPVRAMAPVPLPHAGPALRLRLAGRGFQAGGLDAACAAAPPTLPNFNSAR